VYENVTHGDDLAPRDSGHAGSPGIGDVCRGLADLLHGVPNRTKEHRVCIEVGARSASDEHRRVTSRMEHVLDSHAIVERPSIAFTRHGAGAPL
jgi:hypothetical protein